jgi:hypothetical protein
MDKFRQEDKEVIHVAHHISPEMEKKNSYPKKRVFGEQKFTIIMSNL